MAPSKGGRPSYDKVLRFKIFILQRYYNISDDNASTLSWIASASCASSDLAINDRVPDAKTIWLFRGILAKAGLVEKLFRLLYPKLSRDGIIVNVGKMSGSFVEAPIQRNSRDEHKIIKEAEVGPRIGARTNVTRRTPIHGGRSTMGKNNSDTRTT